MGERDLWAAVIAQAVEDMNAPAATKDTTASRDRGKEPQERKGMASEYQGALRGVVPVDMRIARIFTGGHSIQGAVKTNK